MLLRSNTSHSNSRIEQYADKPAELISRRPSSASLANVRFLFPDFGSLTILLSSLVLLRALVLLSLRALLFTFSFFVPAYQHSLFLVQLQRDPVASSLRKCSASLIFLSLTCFYVLFSLFCSNRVLFSTSESSRSVNACTAAFNIFCTYRSVPSKCPSLSSRYF